MVVAGSCKIRAVVSSFLLLILLTEIVGERLDANDPASILRQQGIRKPDDIGQISSWKERCRNTVGEDAVNDIDNSQTQFFDCLKQVIKWSKLQHEINISIPKGNLDLVFKKYCGRRERIMTCVEDAFTKLERCMNEQEKRDLNITREAIDAGIDFVCHNGGDRIALFMAEKGEECLLNQKDSIRDCVEERVPEIKDMEEDAQNVSLSAFTINGENCKKVNAMHQCVVKYTEKCEDPTPANILDSLITQVLKVTPCWQTSGAPTMLFPAQHLLPHLLTVLAAALTAANILL